MTYYKYSLLPVTQTRYVGHFVRWSVVAFGGHQRALVIKCWNMAPLCNIHEKVYVNQWLHTTYLKRLMWTVTARNLPQMVYVNRWLHVTYLIGLCEPVIACNQPERMWLKPCLQATHQRGCWAGWWRWEWADYAANVVWHWRWMPIRQPRWRRCTRPPAPRLRSTAAPILLIEWRSLPLSYITL